jgi:hypothetical protein
MMRADTIVRCGVSWGDGDGEAFKLSTTHAMVPEMKEVTNLVQCKRPGNVAVEPDEEGALLLVVQTPLRFFPVSRHLTFGRGGERSRG